MKGLPLAGVTEHYGVPLFRRGEGVLRELERVEERHGLGPELTQFLRTRPCILLCFPLKRGECDFVFTLNLECLILASFYS